MYVESGSKVKVVFGRYKGKDGIYSRYSLAGGLHIVVVENISIAGQDVEIALKDGEFTV